MSTYVTNPNDIEAFTDLVREGLPALIEGGTQGGVFQTEDRELLAWTANREAAFEIFLSNGVSYRFRVQQVGESDEAGCTACGELMPINELNGHGCCPDLQGT